MVTSYFRQEVEMSQVLACALKNIKHNPILWQNSRNVRNIPVYLSFYEGEQQSCLL